MSMALSLHYHYNNSSLEELSPLESGVALCCCVSDWVGLVELVRFDSVNWKLEVAIEEWNLHLVEGRSVFASEMDSEQQMNSRYWLISNGLGVRDNLGGAEVMEVRICGLSWRAHRLFGKSANNGLFNCTLHWQGWFSTVYGIMCVLVIGWCCVCTSCKFVLWSFLQKFLEYSSRDFLLGFILPAHKLCWHIRTWHSSQSQHTLLLQLARICSEDISFSTGCPFRWNLFLEQWLWQVSGSRVLPFLRWQREYSFFPSLVYSVVFTTCRLTGGNCDFDQLKCNVVYC